MKLNIFSSALALLSVVSCGQIILKSPYIERIDGSTATYGEPYYGQVITGRIVYAEYKGAVGKPHCTDDYKLPDEEGIPLIPILERGGCTFVTKTRVAAAMGAKAVIIIDSEARSKDELSRIIVADDGTGGDIRIPTILITKADGESLKAKAQSNGENVIAEFQWSVPSSDIASVHFWGDAGNLVSHIFYREFAPHALALGSHMEFTPHVHLLHLSSNIGSLCWDRPTNTPHKYICAGSVPPTNTNIKGSDIIDEDLRQLCIYDNYKISAGSKSTSEMYWNYMQYFTSSQGCNYENGDRKISKACSERVMKAVNIDTEKINSCTSASSATQRLEDEVESMAWSVTALRINGWRFSGSLSADLVLKAVCSGFPDQPSICEDILSPSSFTQLIGYSATSMTLIVLVVMIVLSVIFFFYQRHTQRLVRDALRHEVMHEVKSQLADYTRLQDDDDDMGRGHHRDARPLIL